VEVGCGNDVENVTRREPKEMEVIVRTTVVVVTKRKVAILELVAPHTKVYLIDKSQTTYMFLVILEKCFRHKFPSFVYLQWTEIGGIGSIGRHVPHLAEAVIGIEYESVTVHHLQMVDMIVMEKCMKSIPTAIFTLVLEDQVSALIIIFVDKIV
jgi:hypothetical protein